MAGARSIVSSLSQLTSPPEVYDELRRRNRYRKNFNPSSDATYGTAYFLSLYP
jgi:hypothetical protein